MTDSDLDIYYHKGGEFVIPVEIVNQLMSELDELRQENQELKKQLSTSAIFNEEDIRLDQTKEVFEVIANILNTESCSYRYLIYDLLGFKEENYTDLIAGMSITNAIVELEELKEQVDYLRRSIERKEETIIGLEHEIVPYTNEYVGKLENQQKEFIEYMEEKIICYENYQNTNLGEYERNLYFDIYNDILEKYKETIGVSDEN